MKFLLRSHRQCFVVSANEAPVGVFTDGFAAEVYAEEVGGTISITRYVKKGVAPSPSVLQRLLRYNPTTGKIYWRERPRSMFESDFAFEKFHRETAGNEAVRSINNHGYFVGKVLGRTLAAHRVAWAISHGVWPNEMVDHINGDKRDNRLENLRDVPIAVNNRNRKMSAKNTSGQMGVCPRPDGSWRAIIGTKEIGRFTTFEDACAARLKAEQTHGFHPNHGKRAA